MKCRQEETPLHYSIISKSFEIVKLLLDADVDLESPALGTPIELANRLNYNEIV